MKKYESLKSGLCNYKLNSSLLDIGYANGIIHGDALEVLASLPKESVHFAVTSPPYNINVDYDIYRDDKEYEDYLAWLEKIWMQTKRVLVPGGRLAINVAPTSIANFRPIHHDISWNVRKKVDLIMRTEIIWYKQNMARRTAWGSWKSPVNPHIVPSWEYVMIFSKEKWKLDGLQNDIDIEGDEFIKYSDGFWSVSLTQDEKEQFADRLFFIQPERNRNGHPAPFPEELVRRLLKFYTYRGNIVLDMFGGTGTAALVALKLGRRFIHIDISEEYCKVAWNRIEDYTKQLTLQGARSADPQPRFVRKVDSKPIQQ